MNRGTYTLDAEYEGHAADTLVLKVMLWNPQDSPTTGIANMAFGEVKALKRVHKFVAAGTVPKTLFSPQDVSRFGFKDKVAVILMQKQPGDTLDDIRKQASPEVKRKLTTDKAMEVGCQEVAEVGFTSNIYHGYVFHCHSCFYFINLLNVLGIMHAL